MLYININFLKTKIYKCVNILINFVSFGFKFNEPGMLVETGYFNRNHVGYLHKVFVQ